ncbi:MAG: lipopolysaccharide heptosyltransferase II [Vicinamibacterales bacterium]
MRVEAFDPGTVTRVVVRAPNWLGDAVMALPAMAAVRRTFPRSTLVVAALPSIAPLFEEMTSAAPDEVIKIERRAEIAHLRNGRFDLAILLPNSFRSAWVAKRAGIPHRWGVAASARRMLLTRAVRATKGKVHQSARYLALMERLGITGTDDLPRISLTPPTAARARSLLSNYGIDPSTKLVGFAPGAAYGHAKRWPPARVAQVIARLNERGATGVLVGAADDRDAGREIESALPGSAGIVNLIGRTDLRLLAGVLERCQVFVSNDSGSMHLAAALGVPVVAIFGPTDERVTAPLGSHDVLLEQVFCRPCMLRDCPIDHRCMKRISVDRVFAAAADRLRLDRSEPSAERA